MDRKARAWTALAWRLLLAAAIVVVSVWFVPDDLPFAASLGVQCATTALALFVFAYPVKSVDETSDEGRPHPGHGPAARTGGTGSRGDAGSMGEGGLAAEWPFARCVRFGGAIGATYALLVLLLGPKGPAFEAYYGAAWIVVASLEVIGGLAGGAAVGLLLPRLRGVGGYLVAAMTALVPTYVALAVVTTDRGVDAAVDGLIASVLVGGYVGAVLWFRRNRE